MTETLLVWGLALLATAVLLIIVEVFIPSGGLIAIAATGVAIAGIVCLFRVSVGWGLVGIGVMVVAGPSAFAFWVKVLPHTPFGRKMLGERPESELAAEAEQAERERRARAALLGAEGRALTDLRPVGVVEIAGVRHDALSETTMIQAGTKVRVSVVESNAIRVRPIA